MSSEPYLETAAVNRAANDLAWLQYALKFRGESWTTVQSTLIRDLKLPLNDPVRLGGGTNIQPKADPL